MISGKLKVSRFPQGRQRLSTKRGRGREKIIRRQRLSTQKGRGKQKMISGQLKTSCFPYWQIDTIHKEGKGKGEDNPWASLKLSHFLLGKWSDFPKEGRNYPPHRRKVKREDNPWGRGNHPIQKGKSKSNTQKRENGSSVFFLCKDILKCRDLRINLGKRSP